MVKGLYTAYTGMINEQNRMDVLTNNLANVDTNGYKKEGATSQAFDDVLMYKIKDLSEAGRLSKRIGTGNLGVKIGENYTDYSQGSLKITGNNCDFAITGDGFFNIEFTDKQGNTSTKYTEIRVDVAGDIYQDDVRLNRIKLTEFEDHNYLKHYGENYYEPVEGAKEAIYVGQIRQGYIETSNVQVVDEMVEMISVSRQYESNQKLITTIDGTLEIAANQLGKV